MEVVEEIASAASSNEELLRAFRKSRDIGVRCTLISRNLPLVESLARRYHARNGKESLEDLVQVGSIGLIKAIDRYDPSMDAQFNTYATHQITGEIRHYLRDKGDLIKHPRWLRFFTFQINDEAEKLAQKLGRYPTAREIADSLNINEEGVLEIQRLNQTLSSLSLDEKNIVALQDKIRSPKFVSFQLPVEDKIVLMNALEKLVDLERKAVYLFFYYDLTQVEIGEELGLSQRKVSRVIERGLAKLKGILTSELW